METMEERSIRAATANYAYFPPEILRLIARKLTNICDYMAFRSVCSPWRLAAVPTDFLHPQIPWLILTSGEKNGPTTPHMLTVFNPVDRRFRDIVLPDVGGKFFFGSSHGWLVMIGPRNVPHGHDISLLNPITTSQIPLPRSPAGISLTPKTKVILCFNPGAATPQPTQLLVAILIYEKLIFYRHGDDRWTAFERPPDFTGLGEIEFLKEEARLYHVDSIGRLAVLDTISSILRPLITVPHIPLMYPHIRSFYKPHLVAAAGNQLLMIVQVPVKLSVFRLDKSVGGFRWVQVRDGIGYSALFVSNGKSTSSALCARDFPNGRANQICSFTVDRFGYFQDPSRMEASIRVWDVVDDGWPEVEPRCFRTSKKILWRQGDVLRSTWIVPSLR